MLFMHSDRVLALRMKLAAEYVSLYVVLDRARCQPRAQTTRVQVMRWSRLWILEAAREGRRDET
jgi:hypothetical protein